MKLLDVLDRDLNLADDEPSDAFIGLSSAVAAARLAQEGANELKRQLKKSAFSIWISQYKDIMTLILLVCTAASTLMGEYVEAVAIAAIVLLNGVMGFVQEYRSERTLEALKSMASPTARVYRDGQLTKVPSAEIVRGDVLELTAGDKIPADGIFLEGVGISCDESMLTGESHGIDKDSADNSLFMGCIVKSGHCRMKVTRTGMKTEMGKIASMLNEIKDEPTPLQQKLKQLSKYIAFICLTICFIVSLTGILRGENPLSMLITGVSLAVAAVPEGLPAIVTIALAISVSRMVKRNALIRRLHAVETLGCATVICTDKTGTVTQNVMTAQEVYLSNRLSTAALIDKTDKTAVTTLEALALCSNAALTQSGGQLGSPTESALYKLAASHGFEPHTLSYTRLSERPFDSERKMMSVVVENEAGEKFLLAKGGFDVVLNRSSTVEISGKTLPLNRAEKEKILSQSEKMADSALRVIGVAYKKITPLSPSDDENKLTFLALIGIIDPPRPEVKQAVTRCRRAGIKTVMITGDNINTAVAIAKQVGIFSKNDLALTGSEIDEIGYQGLCKKVDNTTVFARVSPAHKLLIVRALKTKGHIVAMTGDGVNDAPAIKEADIGVAMGITGSDVSKESSDIILLDDNFATLVNAVDEGRSIYSNIRKFIRYLLSCNIGEVITMFIGILMGMPVILTPIQILLVNLVTDGLPAIALGLDPSDESVMSRPPRKSGESIFAHGLASKIFFRGVFIGLTTLLSFSILYSMGGDLRLARSGALFGLIFAQLIHVFECKSETASLFKIPYGNNKKLLFAALISLITLLSVLYLPFLQTVFSTVPLTFTQALIPISLSLAVPLLRGIFNRNE